MNAYAILGAIIAALMYLPLTYKVWTRKLEQNFATYALWGLLDAVAAGSLMAQHGNYLLPLAYVVCSATVLYAILRTKTFTWSWRESVTSLFVVASVIVWLFVSNEMATIVSTAGVVVAGLPQLYDLYKKPRGAPLFEYVGFTVANALSMMAGKDWSIKERLYGEACTILTTVFVLVALRSLLPKYRKQQV